MLCLLLISPAVVAESQYIVSGRESMALNMTHPSPLDDNHLQYCLHLTPDLLPKMEELFVPGPVQQEINIQVSSEGLLGNFKKARVSLC